MEPSSRETLRPEAESQIPSVAFDEIMLAMDVVDTLRHEQAVVERELESEARDQALVERTRQAYAAQGIEVSVAVIEDAIRALREERFVRRPLPRTLAVRLAEVYVDRGWWTRRALTIVVIGGATWLAWVKAPDWIDAGQAYARAWQASRVSSLGEGLRARAASLETELASQERATVGLVAASVERLAQQAHANLERVSRVLAASQIEEARPSALAERRAGLEGVEPVLEEAERALEGIRELNRLGASAGAARTAVLEVAASAEAKQQAEERWDRLAGSLGAGDVRNAVSGLSELEALRRELELAYELRIVSRPGEETGVWRHPRGNRSARNHYIVVEPVAAGRVIEIPVLNEETHRVESVSRFGVRIPAEVYERIRRDKLDDGLLVSARFGAKRRGDLVPTYDFDVAGGFITEW